MKTLLIVFHSVTGAARQMADAALAGAAAEPEVVTRLVAAPAAGPADVLAADGYLFAAPENLATLSGVMKDFFDRTYYPALGRLEGRPYAALIAAGTDGEGAARQLARIATGWRLRAVAAPVIIRNGAQTAQAILAEKHLAPAVLQPCRDVGQAMAAGLAAGIF